MNDYEIINGKPHLGLFLGNAVIVNCDARCDDLGKNPVYLQAKEALKSYICNIAMNTGAFELRHVQWIKPPPAFSDPLLQNTTIAVKYMIWGRAFKVMKLTKKGVKRYKKTTRNNKRKWIRIDL